MRENFFRCFRNSSFDSPLIKIKYQGDFLYGFHRLIQYKEIELNDMLITDMFLNRQIDLNAINYTELVTSLLKKYSVQSVSFHNIKSTNILNDFFYFKQKYYKSWCNLKGYFFKSVQIKKIKKGLGRFTIKCDNSIDDIIELLKLGSPKHPSNDPEHMIHSQACLLEEYSITKQAIVFTLWDENKMQAGLIGLRYKDTLYLIVDNYEIDSVCYYPNDLLYYLLIKYGEENMCKQISWGETQDFDIGLLRFKEHYSTHKELCESCHFLDSSIYMVME